LPDHLVMPPDETERGYNGRIPLRPGMTVEQTVRQYLAAAG
jgi:hypothetical protein